MAVVEQFETWPLFQMQNDDGFMLAEVECAEHPGEEGREWFVKLCGELDGYTVPRLRLALSSLTDGGQVIRLDMSDVTFMDSSGAGLLVEMHKTVTAHGSRIEILDPSSCVHRVLEILRIDAIVDVRDRHSD